MKPNSKTTSGHGSKSARLFRRTVISAMSSSPYLWSCQDEKNLDCVMRLSNIVRCSIGCIGKNIANCSKDPRFLPAMCALVRALC